MPAETLLSGVPLSALAAEATPPETHQDVILSPRNLILYPQGVDLDRDVSRFNEDQVRGYLYETMCFSTEANQLGDAQFALGPGLIDSFRRFGPGRPDALVFRRQKGVLRLIRLSEYSLTPHHTGEKLMGYAAFVQNLWENPNLLRELMENVGIPTVPISIPENRNITIQFTTPTSYTAAPEITYAEPIDFRVGYRSLLIPELSPAHAA